jgi:hypothetical protein
MLVQGSLASAEFLQTIGNIPRHTQAQTVQVPVASDHNRPLARGNKHERHEKDVISSFCRFAKFAITIRYTWPSNVFFCSSFCRQLLCLCVFIYRRIFPVNLSITIFCTFLFTTIKKCCQSSQSSFYEDGSNRVRC